MQPQSGATCLTITRFLPFCHKRHTCHKRGTNWIVTNCRRSQSSDIPVSPTLFELPASRTIRRRNTLHPLSFPSHRQRSQLNGSLKLPQLVGRSAPVAHGEYGSRDHIPQESSPFLPRHHRFFYRRRRGCSGSNKSKSDLGYAVQIVVPPQKQRWWESRGGSKGGDGVLRVSVQVRGGGGGERARKLQALLPHNVFAEMVRQRRKHRQFLSPLSVSSLIKISL